MTILLFEDKLGITSGYESVWGQILLENQMFVEVHRRSSWKRFGTRYQLLIRKGNRKSPGFNPDEKVQSILRNWVESEIKLLHPKVIICMDPALFFLMNPDWDQATADNMRGGVYHIFKTPCICSLPISAWHNKKSEKDIARLNEGFTDKDEWEEEHGGEEQDSKDISSIWIDPVVVPYGKFVLRADVAKAARIMRKAND